jgi:hypothetical protein
MSRGTMYDGVSRYINLCEDSVMITRARRSRRRPSTLAGIHRDCAVSFWSELSAGCRSAIGPCKARAPPFRRLAKESSLFALESNT